MAGFNDLKELLESEAGEIARKLDAKDGNYDGNIDIDVLNQFFEENGFNTFTNPENLKSLNFIDVVKMIYNLKKEQQETGQASIKVDFDPAEEMRKAKKQYERWR